jgi:hypothetical protein
MFLSEFFVIHIHLELVCIREYKYLESNDSHKMLKTLIFSLGLVSNLKLKQRFKVYIKWA